MVGKKDQAAIRAFEDSDLKGPIFLAERMKPLMARGATMGMVTSLAAAVPKTRGLESYATIKGGIVKWCVQNNHECSKDGINIMLIAMGAIGTEVGRNAHLNGPLVKAIEMILPAPERYSQQILRDAMERRSVSCHGFMAELGEFENGGYKIRYGTLGRMAVVKALEIGAWLMKDRR